MSNWEFYTLHASEPSLSSRRCFLRSEARFLFKKKRKLHTQWSIDWINAILTTKNNCLFVKGTCKSEQTTCVSFFVFQWCVHIVFAGILNRYLPSLILIQFEGTSVNSVIFEDISKFWQWWRQPNSIFNHK